jgi:hypothetical protein
MTKIPSSLLAGIVGASSALAGFALFAPCDGRGCIACARCAGMGAAVTVGALCARWQTVKRSRQRVRPDSHILAPAASGRQSLAKATSTPISE